MIYLQTKYLIIGNGIAGLSAAREIRSNDSKGSLTMVTSEPYLTYYRTKLTECLAIEQSIDELLVNKESWYIEKNINILLDKIVEKIDIEKNMVLLDDKMIINYEKLLIATGSRPFIPPINGKYKEGVFALRTFKDLKKSKDYFNKCENVTVIGGGLLGLEAAWSLKQIGKKVKVVEFAPHLLSKQLDKELGDKLAKRLKNEGIEVYLPKSADVIYGDTTVTGIKLNDGEVLETDGILISSGIRPNLDLIRDTSINFDKGIKVDEHLRTNIENIYAAGDVVEVDNMIVGLWTTSNEQGKVAGGNMSGKEIKYIQPKLFSSLKIGGIQIFSAGNIIEFDRVYEYLDDASDIHHKIFTKDGKIIGVILFGDLKELNTLRNAVFNNVDIEDYLKNGLAFK